MSKHKTVFLDFIFTKQTNKQTNKQKSTFAYKVYLDSKKIFDLKLNVQKIYMKYLD